MYVFSRSGQAVPTDDPEVKISNKYTTVNKPQCVMFYIYIYVCVLYYCLLFVGLVHMLIHSRTLGIIIGIVDESQVTINQYQITIRSVYIYK